ncbi:hypothetical protein HJC23_008453 [Cyclotella cryptica]|uniref:Uncharacterized protein n=1 Tax=Cyclotella cryptica TaxID=29204 RepID=A0ABD3QWQ6_9STRA
MAQFLSTAVHSWSVNPPPPPQTHKNNSLMEKALTASALATTLLLSPLNAHAVDFTGSYSDPKHLNCPRLIAMEGSKALITGADGNPNCVGGEGNPWRLVGRIDESKGNDADEIFVDFSPKGGPKDLVGKWEKNGIRWPDGNKWTLEGRP